MGGEQEDGRAACDPRRFEDREAVLAALGSQWKHRSRNRFTDKFLPIGYRIQRFSPSVGQWRRYTFPGPWSWRVELSDHKRIHVPQADRDRPLSFATALFRGLSDLPELNVAVFALLLNFPWELLQAPFFAGMATAPHWPATKDCAQAAVGDAAMTLIAYWFIAICRRSRHWLQTPSPSAIFGFVGFLVVLNVGSEKLATEHLGRWSYADSMPIVPLLGMGVLPLIQWVFLPPIVIWLIRRQLSSILETRSQSSTSTIGGSRSVDRGSIRHDMQDRR